jgi:ADP-heptose:LPS heptosyltransferase
VKIADHQFFESVRGCRRILVIAFGGLGDLVHVIPALRSIRQNFPDARVDVLAPRSGIPFLRLVDGIDGFVPYTVQKTGWRWAHLREFWQLYRGRYDLCINLWASNHMSLVSWVTRAPVRLGRKPYEAHKIGWRLCHTHIADYPHLNEPMYLQWTSMLERLGFKATPEFGLRFDADKLAAAGLDPAQRGRYIHVSPNASESAKELSLPVLTDVLKQLAQRHPDRTIVITSAASPRQAQRVDELVARVDSPQLKVCVGSLKTDELFAVIQGAALHISSDTGPLHMAVAAGTPSVSWFQENPFIREYLPAGDRHFAFVTSQRQPQGITTIAASAIVEKCEQLLARSDSSSAVPAFAP